MTPDERLERIEHVTAAIAEDRRRDREEYRALWRDTQRQLNELTANVNRNTLAIADTRDLIHQLAADSREADARLAAEAREADARLGERIAALVSAIAAKL
ncbi:MAG TPA: hypothetical protein VNY05_32915 [Candidatus Acidoferrales bacterium]|jgi:hypothetical protein|nr:hypothetical protein [Candidatus Acidoferrales bacterium]